MHKQNFTLPDTFQLGKLQRGNLNLTVQEQIRNNQTEKCTDEKVNGRKVEETKKCVNEKNERNENERTKN